MIDLFQSVLNTGHPALVILINGIILAAAAAIVLSRFRSELRGVKWSQRTPEERRELIFQIVGEAWQFAEWMFSHVETSSEAKKRDVARQKKRAAVKYARRELSSAGASSSDLMTVPNRLEIVALEKKPGLRRYSSRHLPIEYP